MTNIKKQLQQAVEEFGEFAHERVVEIVHGVPWYYADNEALYAHANLSALTLKPLSELFAHDISFYINAFEMWEIYDNYVNKQKEWITPSSNKELDYYLSYHIEDGIIRRKTTAALRFDLERAKAGDVVEICDVYGNWSICTSKPFERRKHPLIKLAGVCVSEFNFRMKYPKAINKS